MTNYSGHRQAFRNKRINDMANRILDKKARDLHLDNHDEYILEVISDAVDELADSIHKALHVDMSCEYRNELIATITVDMEDYDE